MSTADARFDMTRIQAHARRVAPMVLLVVAALMIAGLLAALASRLPATRIGDGEEYYAMQIAWADTHRPFMTEPAWVEYDKLYQSHEIALLYRSPENLRAMFPELILGSTADFNHFWMYSALAAALQSASSLLAVDISRHQSFILLHAVLFALVLIFAFRWQGVAGAAAWLLLSVGSPFIWYFNKVHTEFFTASLTVLAMAAALKHRWSAAGLALALASTQNISFMLPAFLACVLAFFRLRNAKPEQRTLDAGLLSLAALLALLHPAYYFFRHGVWTPQILAGGAQLGDINPLVAFNFIFDLNVGLFPNWPLGIFIAVLGAFAVIQQRPRDVAWLVAFIAVYVLSSLLAQSATTSINAGATVNVSRYGLWYICLLYPPLIWALDWMSRISRTKAVAIGAAASTLVLVSLFSFNPARVEHYLEHTPQARWFYSTLPSLLAPNQEVFLERSTMLEEGGHPRPSVVLGPSCRLALVLDGDLRTPPHVLGRDHCDMHRSSLIALLRERGAWSSRRDDHYMILSKEDIASLFGSVSRGAVLTAAAPQKDMAGHLESGWSTEETWGVWSDGPVARIGFGVRGDIQRPLKITFVMQAFLPNGHALEVVPTVNGKAHASWSLKGAEPMPFSRTLLIEGKDLAASGGRIRIQLGINRPLSPLAAGISNDVRKLGIGMISMAVE